MKHTFKNKKDLTPVLCGQFTLHEILNKAIRIIDPDNSWGRTYDGKIRVRYITMNAVSEYNDLIEIDNQIVYWSHNHSGSLGKGWYVKNGEYFRSIVNNNSDSDIIVKDSSILNRMRWSRRNDYCQFGFLMELKNSGLILDKQIIRKKFQDRNCLALTFNSKDSKVPDNYFEEVNLAECTKTATTE